MDSGKQEGMQIFIASLPGFSCIHNAKIEIKIIVGYYLFHFIWNKNWGSLEKKLGDFYQESFGEILIV